MKKSHYDVLIIGGGPAGCSCALWLKHLGFNPLIVEIRGRLGGLQNDSPYSNGWILGKNYLNGKAFSREVNKQIKGEKIAIRFNTQITHLKFNNKKGLFEIVIRKNDSISEATSEYVVLSSGVSPNTGGLEPSSQVLIGPGHLIEKSNFNGKTVAILGGGDNAFENYQFIKKQRPKSIKIFARHVRAQFPFVKKINKGDLKVGSFTIDKIGKKINGEVFDVIVVMYGWHAVNVISPFFALKTIKGFVKTDLFRRTSFNRIYAIGEVTQASHPCCVTAMADGIIAAKDIQNRIDSKRVASEVKRKL
ncbi:MAG: NAD(P)/FAD-dependent oxidoreductase [Bdellovibrionales bacterium]|nr:NAD(P)/FAD-dependent oxidoreductase [Bdellovibrionales bacterium]